MSRAERRSRREQGVRDLFGEEHATAALDLLELTELAWHDCYGQISPPDEIVADMLVISGGDLEGLVYAAHLAVSDWRDLRIMADERRQSQS